MAQVICQRDSGSCRRSGAIGVARHVALAAIAIAVRGARKASIRDRRSTERYGYGTQQDCRSLCDHLFFSPLCVVAVEPGPIAAYVRAITVTF
jgi:hypothetical protein